MVYPRQSMFPILDADAPPDVLVSGERLQLSIQLIAHSFRTLRQHLKGVPLRGTHDGRHIADERIRNAILKQIAHRIDEDHSRSEPAKGFLKFLRHESEVKALFIR